MTNKGKIILTSFISIMLVCALGIGTCLIYNQMTADASMSAKSEAIAAGYTIEVGNYMASGYTTTATGEKVYKVYCDNCHGSGRVGERSLDCGVCSGKGYFWMKGDKVLDCADCHGFGEKIEYVYCEDCDAVWHGESGNWIKCNKCDENGQIDCPSCDGQGYERYRGQGEWLKEKHACKDCGGQGVTSVWHDNYRAGTGKVPCECQATENKGYFWEPCKHCPGPDCMGGKMLVEVDKGPCTKCEDGQVTCTKCHGDGEYTYCTKVGEHNVPWYSTNCKYCGLAYPIGSCSANSEYKTIDCPDCGGTGAVDCPNCIYGRVIENEWQDCPLCIDGRMDKIETTPCKTCNGQGWEDLVPDGVIIIHPTTGENDSTTENGSTSTGDVDTPSQGGDSTEPADDNTTVITPIEDEPIIIKPIVDEPVIIHPFQDEDEEDGGFHGFVRQDNNGFGR